MNKLIPTILLFIFTLFNYAIIHNMYSLESQVTISIVEEEENHIKILEVKHYLKKDSPFLIIFKPLDETSKSAYYLKLNKYKDVYLATIESPPDFMC